jgi:beta-galactosidase
VSWKTVQPADAKADGETVPEAVEISIRQSVAAMSNQPVLRMNNKATVFADGRILLDVQADKDPEYPDLPRIGLRLFLCGSMKKVRYFGMGPMETYIDKHHAGRHGYFKGTAASMQEDYIRPQESGSHYDCDFVTVKGKGLRLTVASADADPDSTFSFNASVYTQEELEAKGHNYELEPCGSTVLCIDHRMAGIGSHSCGPELLPEYRVSGDRFCFSFVLKPEEM